MLVEVHLANPGDEARQGQKIGLCYSLIAPKTFPVDEGTLRSNNSFIISLIGADCVSGHRIRNAPETTGWQITLQKSTDPASQSNVYTGTISNTIKASEISTFADKEESDVELEPIILSVEADRADRSMDQYEDALTLTSRLLKDSSSARMRRRLSVPRFQPLCFSGACLTTPSETK